MHKYLLLAAFLLTALSSQAQNKASIKGRVTDSLNNTSVDFATVAVLSVRDTSSTLLSYTLSDKNGSFGLHNLPEGVALKILITFVGYQPFRKNFILRKGETLDFGNITLSTKNLDAVVVKGERIPISVRKDTIEFNAEAFKTRPNALVEDLLKKLPGVEVGSDGKLTVMGRDVTKVLVDGHEFFATDPRIATKNLDADMIAKVQVYDDRENDPDNLIPDIDVKKIVNLKLKKALKKSIFGKVYGGAGTRDHYQSGGLVNMFRDTLQVSVLGMSNNLNNTGFDFGDLYDLGGVSRGGEAFARGGFGYGGSATGRVTTTSGGVNVNTDYGKKFKANLAYFYNRTESAFNTLTKRQQFIGDTTAVTNSTIDRSNTVNRHNISGTLTWKPNTATQLKYTPFVTITQNDANSGNMANSYSNYLNPINKSTNSNTSSGNIFQLQQSLNFNHQFKKKGSSINIDHNLTVSPGSNETYDNQELISYSATLPSFRYRRLGDNRDKTLDATATATYRYPVTTKMTVDIGTTLDYNSQLNRVSTYDYNPVTGQYDQFIDIQSSDLTRNKFMESVNPGVTYNFPKSISLVAHMQLQYQQVNNVFNRNAPNINRNYLFAIPNVNLNFKSLSFGYSQSVNLPNIGDMIPYTVVFSPLYSVTGNPDLEPTRRNNFNVNFRKFKYQTGTSIYLNAGVSFEQNGIFRQRTIDQNLVETSTPINRDGRNTLNLGGNITQRLNKSNDFQLSLNSNVNLYRTHDFYVLNNQNGYQNASTISYSQQFMLNWKDIIEAEPQYNMNFTRTAYRGVNVTNQSYVSHNFNGHFNINWQEQHVGLEGNYTYRYNPLVPAGFQKNSNLLSLSLSRRFLKKERAEIKLSCYDILNQSISLSRSFTENNVIDTQSQVIKRYFMLTLQFKFNKSTTKESAQSAAPRMIIR